MLDIGLPSLCRIGPIVDAARPELAEDRRVEGVGGHGHEDFVPAVAEDAEREVDALGSPGREHDALGRYLQPAGAELRGHRGARLADARGGSVAVVAVAHRALDRLDQVRGRLETEEHRVADVQVPYAAAARLDRPRLGDDIADGVVEAGVATGDGNRIADAGPPPS